MNRYSCLNKQIFKQNGYQVVPIRYEDMFKIMKWRNEQIYHLRQSKLLTEKDQESYFIKVVAKLFNQENPAQLLFSYLENGVCIGYGGLVHINWLDRNAEISFIMDTSLEKEFFKKYWSNFLKLIEQVAFEELKLHKLTAYSYDIRPHLYEILEKSNYLQTARLKKHTFIGNKFIDVLIHEKMDKRSFESSC